MIQNHPSHADNHPLVLGVFELAEILKKTPTSVFNDRSRAPHRLPPDCTPPGTQKPLWLLSDVLAWLASHRTTLTPAPAAPPPPQDAPPRRRGRPTKAEQARRARLNAEAELNRAAEDIAARKVAEERGEQ